MFIRVFSQVSSTMDQTAATGTKRKAESVSEPTEVDNEPKKRRVRTTYTKAQLRRLEGYFMMSPYPDLLMRSQIAEVIGVSEQKIQVRCLCILSRSGVILLSSCPGLVSE